MKLLLDTQLLLWAAGQPDRLSVEAREAIENVHNELMFSSASLWEVAIKSMLGRPDFRVDARVLRRGLLETRYIAAIAEDHAVAVLTVCSSRKLQSRALCYSQPTHWLHNIPARSGEHNCLGGPLAGSSFAAQAPPDHTEVHPTDVGDSAVEPGNFRHQLTQFRQLTGVISGASRRLFGALGRIHGRRGQPGTQSGRGAWPADPCNRTLRNR